MAKKSELGQHFVTCEGITYCMEGISTVEQAIGNIAALLGLPLSNQLNWRAEQNGKLLSISSGLSPFPLLLVPSPGLRGGKGGLGSQLKAIGIKMDGSKNTESMRDLDGRRQRGQYYTLVEQKAILLIFISIVDKNINFRSK